jgi:hypothetical protein
MVNTLNIPVTAKIRRLSTDEETVDLVRRIEDVGVSMVTVHGRTVEQSKLFTGPCDWGVIKAVKEAVSIPVVANGGVQCRQDALDCLDFTGADMVMSSEALLENPKLFSVEGDIAFRETFVRAQLDTVREYLDTVRSYPLPSPLYQVVRSHLFKMLFRFMDAPSNRDLRTLLGTGDVHDMDYVLLELERRFDGVQGTPDEIPDLVSRGLLGPTMWYVFCYTIVLPSFLVCDVSVSLLSIYHCLSTFFDATLRLTIIHIPQINHHSTILTSLITIQVLPPSR